MVTPNNSLLNYPVTTQDWASRLADRVIALLREEYPRFVMLRVQGFDLHPPHAPSPDPNMLGYQLVYIMDRGYEPLYASGIVRIVDDTGSVADINACAEEFAATVSRGFKAGVAAGSISHREGMN